MDRNELAKSQQSTLATLPKAELQKAVFKFSLLRSFPLSQIEILEWARVLENANIETEAVEFVILKMQTCEMEYNDREGIQNIFRNLRLIKKKSRCCGRCNGTDDVCIADQVCKTHNVVGCRECWPENGYEVLKTHW